MSVTVNTMNLLKDSNPSELKVLGENVYSVQNGDSDLILEVLKFKEMEVCYFEVKKHWITKYLMLLFFSYWFFHHLQL